MRSVRYAAGAAVLALALVGCGGDDPDPEPAPEPTSEPTSEPSASPTPSESTTASPSPSGDPALDWQPVEGSTDDVVTRGGDWTLTVTDNGAIWSLDGPQGSSGGGASGWRVSDTLLDEEYAVVVLQDRTESKPSRAEVTELASGRTFTLDGSSDVPTTNGGAWALGDGRLLHATIGPGRAYCVASVDLGSRESTRGWCAPKRHGFNGLRITPAGDSLLSFNAGQPSCRTLMALEGTEATPFEGVEECKAWDGLRTEDGAVWSVIPKERQIENGQFYASTGGETTDLGPGVAGSLVWCAGAAYFARDPQTDGGPAELVRWTTDGPSVVYESKGGQAFISEPRCGGDAITITVLAESGDEQVTASLS